MEYWSAFLTLLEIRRTRARNVGRGVRPRILDSIFQHKKGWGTDRYTAQSRRIRQKSNFFPLSRRLHTTTLMLLRLLRIQFWIQTSSSFRFSDDIKCPSLTLSCVVVSLPTPQVLIWGRISISSSNSHLPFQKQSSSSSNLNFIHKLFDVQINVRRTFTIWRARDLQINV